MTISTEPFLFVNTGTSANDGTGDSLRAAFIKVNQNFANISDIGFDAANVSVQGSIDILGNIFVSNDYVPSLANSAGTTGQVTWDSNHVYICVSTNTWKRANLAAW